MKRVLPILLIALILASCVPLPAPAPARSPLVVPKRATVRLPIVIAPRPWPWPRWGYGAPNETQLVVNTQPLQKMGAWWYDWTQRCLDAKQIPMIYNRNLYNPSSLSRCNDGRPILIGNECHASNECNMSPQDLAALVDSVAAWWEGEIWCCGSTVQQAAYDLQVIEALRQKGSLPISGWAVHDYANFTLASAREFASLKDPWRAEASLQLLDRYVATLRAAGVPVNRVILTEYGALSKWWWHQPADFVPLFRAYQEAIARRPLVISAAWFAAETTSFESSDLVRKGQLTPLGQAWTAAAAR
jgi:hypothetical protein